MPPDEAVLHLAGVSRRYGHRWVLQGVDLAVAPGDVVLLMGRNGVGKTTLLRLAAGLLRPTVGRVERRGSVGLVAHHPMVYDALTARENLRFVARLHGLSPRPAADAALERLGLAPFGDQPIATYSRGMLQRLAAARALLHDPDLLLLDEPLSGLDDGGARTLLDAVRERSARGGAAVVAAHQIGDLLPLATRVGFLASGRLAALEPREGRGAEAVMARYRALAAGGG